MCICLDRVDRLEIGLKLPRSWVLSFLWIGTTFAVFHSSGNIPDVIDMLKILVRGAAMAGAAKRNNVGGKLSFRATKHF